MPNPNLAAGFEKASLVAIRFSFFLLLLLLLILLNLANGLKESSRKLWHSREALCADNMGESFPTHIRARWFCMSFPSQISGLMLLICRLISTNAAASRHSFSFSVRYSANAHISRERPDLYNGQGFAPCRWYCSLSPYIPL